MPEESPNEARLQELRNRWEVDKTPRVLLQLCEELRRHDRASETIALLEEGLREHPDHLSFQVALGRGRLEVGEALSAVEILEVVVGRDPTQMVANKLLVQAYVAAGDAKGARERLFHYSLLASGDPEVETLEAAVAALEAGRNDDSVSAIDAPAEEVAVEALPEAEAFPEASDETPAVSALPVAMPDAPFGDLSAPTPSVEYTDVFGITGVSAEGSLPDESQPEAEEYLLTPEPSFGSVDDEPFGALLADPEAWGRALESEGIFTLSPESAVAAAEPGAEGAEETLGPESAQLAPEKPEAAVAELPGEVAMGIEAEPAGMEEPSREVEASVETPPETEAAPDPDLELVAEPEAEPLAESKPQAEPELEAPEAQPPFAPEDHGPPATVSAEPRGSEPREEEEDVNLTLGTLYLRQGHYSEARAIFEKLAAGEEAGSLAHRRLDLLRGVADRAPTAAELGGGEDGSAPNRRAKMLGGWIGRIREGAARRVP